MTDNPITAPTQTGMNWPDRFRAALIHLAISAAVAGLAAALVFGVWYPYPYREISSGRELFLIVMAVDVVLGPLLTLAIFNRKKPATELRRDLGVVGALQLAALCYGLWTVFVARPVHLVFEYDRFRVLHAIDLPPEIEAEMGAHRFPVGAPTPLGLRGFKDSDEQMTLTKDAIAGLSLSARPQLWQPYELSKPMVLNAAKPLATLKARFPAQSANIDAAVARTGQSPEQLATVPMIGRKTFWTVLIDAKSAQVLGFLPIDSF